MQIVFFVINLIIIVVLLSIMGAYFMPLLKRVVNKESRKKPYSIGGQVAWIIALTSFTLLRGAFMSWYPETSHTLVWVLLISIPVCAGIISITPGKEVYGYYPGNETSLTQWFFSFLLFGIFVALLVMKFTLQ